MMTVDKNAALGTLGLPSGDHWVKFHVAGDVISYEVAASKTVDEAPVPIARKPTGFVEQWGGTAMVAEDASDEWLTHINEKHLR
jgi:hypothetical protein